MCTVHLYEIINLSGVNCNDTTDAKGSYNYYVAVHLKSKWEKNSLASGYVNIPLLIPNFSLLILTSDTLFVLSFFFLPSASNFLLVLETIPDNLGRSGMLFCIVEGFPFNLIEDFLPLSNCKLLFSNSCSLALRLARERFTAFCFLLG